MQAKEKVKDNYKKFWALFSSQLSLVFKPVNVNTMAILFFIDIFVICIVKNRMLQGVKWPYVYAPIWSHLE